MAKKNKISLFFKNIGLLLRCLFGAISYTTLWVGIALYNAPFGIWLIIIGALATVIAVLTNIVIPVMKLK